MNFIAENAGEVARPTAPPPSTCSPTSAGIYFNKIECFCFTEQALKPGERIEMPVQFFVSPDLADDRDLDGDADDHALLYVLSGRRSGTTGRAGGRRRGRRKAVEATPGRIGRREGMGQDDHG